MIRLPPDWKNIISLGKVVTARSHFGHDDIFVMHTNPWKWDFLGGGGGGWKMCWRDVSPFLVWEIIKTRNTGVNQRAFLDCAHYAAAWQSPWSNPEFLFGTEVLLWARWKCPCVPVVALLFHTVWESVCVWVCCYTYLMKSWTKVPGGDLKGSRRGRGVMFPSHPVSHRASSRARGEVFYPLMNWDCWSKVWIIEFLINYPELLSDKSAPLQPPSSSVVFYLIWSASCSPGLALRCPCLINSNLVMEPEAAAWLSVCFDGSYGVCPLLWWFFNDFYCLLRGNKSCFF